MKSVIRLSEKVPNLQWWYFTTPMSKLKKITNPIEILKKCVVSSIEPKAPNLQWWDFITFDE